MVRVAGALIIAYGVLGLLGALAVAFLMQDAATSRRLGIGGILGGSLWVWVGIKLLQRRRWALILGRVLAVPATIILVIALAADRLALDPAVLVLRLAQISLALAIAIALFLPVVSTAFGPPRRRSVGHRAVPTRYHRSRGQVNPPGSASTGLSCDCRPQYS